MRGGGGGVLGVGCGVWGVGCGMWGVGCGVWDVGCWVLGSNPRKKSSSTGLMEENT